MNFVGSHQGLCCFISGNLKYILYQVSADHLSLIANNLCSRDSRFTCTGCTQNFTVKRLSLSIQLIYYGRLFVCGY